MPDFSKLNNLKDKANSLPQLPGVYLMKDEKGEVIYVGKAVRLKSRVVSYFRFAEAQASGIKTDALVSKIHDFEVIAVASEFEALVLENDLIKKLMPKYNIKLRDDKGYPFIKVNLTDDYPIFKIVPYPLGDSALYLGPYGGRTDTRKALNEVCRAFGLPTCGKKIKSIIGKERPCLNYDIGNCRGYCADAKLAADYKNVVRAAIDVFEGKTKSLSKRLEKDMNEASKALNFEAAALLRDQIKAIKVLEQKQFFKEEPVGEEDALYKEKQIKAHLWLEKALYLPKTPSRIEAYDISNTADSNIVGSMVVFVGGKPYKKDYRRFMIKTKKTQDDYACMSEVISRRVRRHAAGDEKFAALPDIILVDGGASHARAAVKTLEKNGIDIPVFGMVKDDKHKTRALVSQNGDEVGLFGNPSVFALIGSIQEEAHRFAIEYHRKLRSKDMLG
ncbi:MAG: excinuclease ABC subunit UvrC [Oscillospiraceae bacterium]|nr:excinuclease ABC subunit UvrC [Oscillospiraceae bacterium]